MDSVWSVWEIGTITLGATVLYFVLFEEIVGGTISNLLVQLSSTVVRVSVRLLDFRLGKFLVVFCPTATATAARGGSTVVLLLDCLLLLTALVLLAAGVLVVLASSALLYEVEVLLVLKNINLTVCYSTSGVVSGGGAEEAA